MACSRLVLRWSIVVFASVAATTTPAWAQGQTVDTRWAIDLAVGLDLGINGNVNSGAIGQLNGQTAAILPNSYGDVYGTGIQLRVGGGYALDALSEVRGVFTFQSADADLVRLGDLGPSSLYAQYSDYQTLSLDFGYRRYLPIEQPDFRVYGEASVGVGFIDAIDAELAAPQSNLVLATSDFYDQTAAFTFTVAAGVLFKINERLDLNGQIGVRHVSGLAEVDQLVGSGLEDINNDSGRLTIPVIIGLRIRF